MEQLKCLERRTIPSEAISGDDIPKKCFELSKFARKLGRDWCKMIARLARLRRQWKSVHGEEACNENLQILEMEARDYFPSLGGLKKYHDNLARWRDMDLSDI